ncbi:MAG: PAS domain S-box protein [Roseiarcus sp.]
MPSSNAPVVDVIDDVPTYEVLVQGVVDYAIYMLSPEGLVTTWNSGAERIKGYSAAEIIGAHFSRFYTDEDRAAGVPERALKTALEVGRYTAEAWRRRKDGSLFWALVVIDAIHKDGKLIGFAKVTRDMTAQHEAAAVAAETERRFRLLVQSVTDYAIYMLDPQGRITNWNTGAQRIKGYTAAEIVGEHFSRFYTPEDIANGVPGRALETALREGRFEAEAWRVRKDGSRFWANVVIDPILEDGKLLGFAKVTRDLTERRKGEIELEQSREQLLQSQKMEAVGQLTGGLAHDFNNLLTGVIGNLELIKARIAQGRLSDLDRYAAGALGSANRAAALTQRLLTFSRRQTLDAKPTDGNKLISDMVEQLIKNVIGPQIENRVELAKDASLILCDPNQLETALLNLCINARDAMPEGGVLTIKTNNLALDKVVASTLDLLPGEYIAITVSDTGVGMPPDVVAHVFEPFFTTKPLGVGTGLGLSMVYGFVRQSGGQVTVKSEVGKGATISMYLPRADPDETADQESVSTPARAAAAGHTVVVVDDEAMIRMLIVDVLQDLGYLVLEASTGAAGLKAIRSNARIDLLITDVGLPGGMNGRQLAEAARQARPDLQVLFITGYAEASTAGAGGLGPDMHVLTKPFTLEALAGKMSALLGK